MPRSGRRCLIWVTVEAFSVWAVNGRAGAGLKRRRKIIFGLHLGGGAVGEFERFFNFFFFFFFFFFIVGRVQ